MSNLTFAKTAALLLALAPLCALGENLLRNGNFENGFSDIGFSYASLEGAGAEIADCEHGKCLKFSLPAKSDVALNFSETNVDPKGVYKLSFRAKTKKGDCLLRARAAAIGEYSATFRTLADFNVGEDWKQFSAIVDMKKHNPIKNGKQTGIGDWLILGFENKSEAPAELSLAQVAVEPVKAAPRLSSVRVEIADKKKNRFRVFPKNAQIKFLVEIDNPAGEVPGAEIRAALSDWRGENKFYEKVRIKNIPSGKSTHAFTVRAPNKYGVYSFRADALKRRNECKFAVSPKVRSEKGSLPVDTGYDGMPVSALYSQEKQLFELLADSGITYLRTGSAFYWNAIEPEDGKFNFSAADKCVEYAESCGLQMLPVLGGMFFVYKSPPKNQPFVQQKWLAEKSEKVRTIECFEKIGRSSLKPPLDLWERMVRAVAERYAGRIGQYEIMNEPNSLWRDFSTYLPYLKSSHEIIKKIDPAARVVGFSTSSDYGADISGFFAVQLKLGAGKYCDAISFHSYGSPFEDSPKPGDGLLREFRGFLKNNGLNLPLWNTELFYLNPKCKLGGGDHKNGPIFHAGYVQRRYLLDAANDIEVSILLQASQPFQTVRAVKCGNFLYGGGRRLNANFSSGGEIFAPTEKYVATAAFAMILKNTKFYQKHISADKFARYDFKSENSEKTVAAVFALEAYAANVDTRKYEPITEIVDPLRRESKNLGKPPEGVKIYDYLGNALPRSKEFILEASPIPVYFEAENKKVLDEFLSPIK